MFFLIIFKIFKQGSANIYSTGRVIIQNPTCRISMPFIIRNWRLLPKSINIPLENNVLLAEVDNHMILSSYTVSTNSFYHHRKVTGGQPSV